MANLRFAFTVVLAVVSIAIPAWGVALFFGPVLGGIVAVCVAGGIGGGRWLAAKRQGGGASGPSANRGRRRQSKGARGGRDR